MFDLPPQIRALQKVPGGSEWLNQLNVRISAAIDRWHITLDKPYPGSSVSVVFPAILPGGKPAVLKIQFPHRESKHESEALRRWNGKGAVRIIDNDPENCVLLIERCEPGEYLSAVGPEKALQVLTALLPRLWIEAGKPFTSLSDEAGNWAAQLPKSWARAGKPFEVVLVDSALEALHGLRTSQGAQVLIHQDLHGDNVLRASREPWLVIDPKPLTGEREFSVAPIVRSCEFGHSRKSVIGRLDKLTSALKLDRERSRLWSLVQTLSWAFEDDRALPRHVETARWLKQS